MFNICDVFAGVIHLIHQGSRHGHSKEVALPFRPCSDCLTGWLRVVLKCSWLPAETKRLLAQPHLIICRVKDSLDTKKSL